MIRPIELHGAPTGNCIRAAIALEEAGLPYLVRHVDLRSGEQQRPPLRVLNPAGKVPVMVDFSDAAAPLVLSQSNAIVLYAAERAPETLLPRGDLAQWALALERFFFFVTDVIGPNHAAFYLKRQQMSEGVAALESRAAQRLTEADAFVERSPFMAGDRFTIADIAAFTIVSSMHAHLDALPVPNLKRWLREVATRSSIVKGYQAFDTDSA